MVERIQKLGPELCFDFLPNLCGLDARQVEVAKSGRAHVRQAPWERAEVRGELLTGRPHETGVDVEPLADGALIVRQGDIGIVAGVNDIPPRHWRPALPNKDTLRLPAPDE